MTSERQLGLLWGAVAAVLVALAPLIDRLATNLPGCPWKALLALPCPTCGATRAAVALAHLDLPGAVAVSPLAAAGWIGLVAGGLVVGALALLGLDPPQPPRRLAAGWRLAVVAAVLANWGYLLWTGG